MDDPHGYVMFVVLNGLCKYESLVDGSLNLEDVLRMRESFFIKNENERRISEWRKM